MGASCHFKEFAKKIFRIKLTLRRFLREGQDLSDKNKKAYATG